jgi:hypothetical protein
MRITTHELALFTSGVRLADKTRSALHDVMVSGRSWERACARNGVAASTIARAIRRCRRAGPVESAIDPFAHPRCYPHVVGVKAYGERVGVGDPREAGALMMFDGSKWKILRRINYQRKEPR